MRKTLLTQMNSSQFANSLKTAMSVLAYRCMVAMRVVSPYLFAAAFFVLPPVSHITTPQAMFLQQNAGEG